MEWIKKLKNPIQNKRLYMETYTQSPQSRKLVQKNPKLGRQSNMQMWRNRNNRPYTNRMRTKQKQRYMARSRGNVEEE